MAIAVCNKKKTLLTSKFDLNLRKKLVEPHIWSIALLNKVFIMSVVQQNTKLDPGNLHSFLPPFLTLPSLMLIF
jgi:hypothetical protein